MSVLKGGEIVLYGVVGADYFAEFFTASQVLDALAELGRDADVKVRINSGGGIADEGLAIFNALTAHPGRVSVEVDSMAASAASLIAMAGDTITMRRGAVMMIHDPATITIGPASDHEFSAEVLNKRADLFAGIYADKSGESATRVRKDMKAELWLTGPEAVDRGFATDTDDRKAETVTAFDYRVYSRAPKKLVSMSKKRRWSFGETVHAAVPPANPKSHKKEKPKMTVKQEPAVAAATEPDQAQIEAIEENVKARIEEISVFASTNGCEALGKHLAFKTTQSAADAIATMKAAIDDQPSSPGDAPAAQSAKTYQARRTAAADMAAPGGGAPKRTSTLNTSKVYSDRRNTTKGV